MSKSGGVCSKQKKKRDSRRKRIGLQGSGPVRFKPGSVHRQTEPIAMVYKQNMLVFFFHFLPPFLSLKTKQLSLLSTQIRPEKMKVVVPARWPVVTPLRRNQNSNIFEFFFLRIYFILFSFTRFQKRFSKISK